MHPHLMLDLTTCVSCGLPHRGSALCLSLRCCLSARGGHAHAGPLPGLQAAHQLVSRRRERRIVLLCLADSIRATARQYERTQTMTSIEDLTKHFQQEHLDKLYLGQRVGFRWKNGAWHTGTVMVLHAKSRQAYILEDDGVVAGISRSRNCSCCRRLRPRRRAGHGGSSTCGGSGTEQRVTPAPVL